MFGWFWEFLYSISKTLFRLTDGLILCANKLCGIETIDFDGEEMDLLTYLFSSNEVSFAFKVAALLATILVVIFTVFMIIRSIAKDKAEGSPVQLAVKAFKTIVLFFLVPAIIIAFIAVGNVFLNALYKATINASSSPGAFLFSVFAEDGGMPAELANLFRTGQLDYTDTDKVQECMELSNFPFIFSWLAGGVVLFGVGSSMLIFVDRVLSLAILYIASPISISTCVIDEGARFKLWRDQFLSKFIMGYGMIISINIYALVCGLVMEPDFAFFPNSGFLDLIMKLLIIGGGAMTMQKSMAIVGNLVSAGAGSNELRDNAFSAGKLASMAASVAGNTVGLPFKAGKSILGDALSLQSRHLAAKGLRALHLGGGGEADDKKDKDKDKDKDSGSDNKGKAEYGSKDGVKDAFKLSFGGGGGKDKGDNTNNNEPKKDNNPVGQAIDNGQNKQNENNGGNGEQPQNGGGDQQ